LVALVTFRTVFTLSLVVLIVASGEESPIVKKLVMILRAAASASGIALFRTSAWVAQKNALEVPLVVVD
jgi:hypothetical protein